MRFPTKPLPGRLIKRYKRFLADIQLDSGELITAHCANPGAMLGIKAPDSRVWVSPVDNPNRKLKYTWQLVEAEGALVGVNTHLPNAIIEEAIQDGRIASLSQYTDLRREVPYGKNSRIDLLLSKEGLPDCYVEVKNAHLKRETCTLFPDSVTVRGAKHLVEMTELCKKGLRAVMVYCIQRADCTTFSLAEDIDPAYAQCARTAFAAGVEALAYSCSITLEGIEVKSALPILFK